MHCSKVLKRQNNKYFKSDNIDLYYLKALVAQLDRAADYGSAG